MISAISLDLPSIGAVRERRASGSNVIEGSLSALLAPVITASGVRRSCEMLARSVLRSRSVSAVTRDCSASSCRPARSSASAICATRPCERADASARHVVHVA